MPDGARLSDLERLWRGLMAVRAREAMVAALERVAEIAGSGLGSTELAAVPARRVVGELGPLRHDRQGTGPRRHPYSRKLGHPGPGLIR